MSFTKLSLFNLNKPLGPCLVQALYCIALVLIALGLLRGIVGGVRMMSAPVPIMAAANPAPPATAQVPANPPAMRPPRPGRFGFRGRPFRGPPGPLMGVLRG